MYNALFGYNKDADELLDMLGFNRDSFPRFRDCYLSHDFENIIVYTRSGGPNRVNHAMTIHYIKQSPYYVKDLDDTFDETFMSFYFNIPENKRERVKEISKDTDTTTGQDKFQKLMKDVEEKGMDEVEKTNPRMKAFNENLVKTLNESTGGILSINPDGSIDIEEVH